MDFNQYLGKTIRVELDEGKAISGVCSKVIEASKSPVNENIISIKDKTLKEFLYEQMREIDLTTEMKKVISYMIECLDERGYLNEDVSYIAKVLNIKVDIVQKSLEVLQGFDPVGIAAKDIKQCLKLQVKDLQFIFQMLKLKRKKVSI